MLSTSCIEIPGTFIGCLRSALLICCYSDKTRDCNPSRRQQVDHYKIKSLVWFRASWCFALGVMSIACYNVFSRGKKSAFKERAIFSYYLKCSQIYLTFPLSWWLFFTKRKKKAIVNCRLCISSLVTSQTNCDITNCLWHHKTSVASQTTCYITKHLRHYKPPVIS